MKLFKLTTIVGIAVLSMACATCSIAQTAGPAGGSLSQTQSVAKTKHPLLNALNMVNLTADEKTKVNQILNTRDQDNKAFKKAHKGDQLAIQAHSVTEKKTAMDAIKSVLTPAQWDQLTALLHKGKKAKK